MITAEELHKYVEGLGKSTRERVERDDEKLVVWKRGEKIFLVEHEGSDPLRVETGVGKELARLLTEKYESVMKSRNMDERAWVEVICSGQLSDEDVIDLVRASWERAASE